MRRFARWIIKFFPRVFPSKNQVAQQNPGDGAVRHAVARITGRDVYILLTRIAANEREPIDWLHHLAGPSIIDCSHLETFSRPCLQFPKTIFGMIFLSGLMIFSPDD